MAARNLGSLTIDLVAKTAGFERGMDRASRKSQSSMRNIERNAKIAGAAIGTALVAASSLATNAIRSQINAMDDLSKAAQRAYMPTEEFSQLAYAGSLADVEMGNLTTSMGRLARAQSDAQRGLLTQVDAFEKLGIAFEDSTGQMRSGMDVLKDFADVVQQRQGDPEVLAAGMQIFGRSFQNLIPLLSQGREGLEAAADEANRLGITLSTQSGKQAEEFNDNLTRLKTSIDGVVRGVAVDLLPKLVELTDQMVDWVTEGDNVAKSVDGISNSIETLVGWLVGLHANLGLVRAEMAKFEIGASLYNPLTHIRSAFIDGGEFRDEQIALWEQAAADAEKYRERLDRLASGQGLLGPRRGADFRNVTGGATTGAQREAEALRKAAADAAEQTRKEEEARAAAAEAVGRASASAARDMQAMLQEQQRLTDAQRVWTDQLLDAQAAMAGPVAEANRQHEKQMANLNRAYDEGEVRLSDYVQMQEVYEHQLGETLEAIEAMRTPAQRMLEDLEFEKDLLRMTNEEREVAIALRWLNSEATDAERDAIANSVRELRQSREAMSDLIEAQDAVRGAGADFLTDWTTGAKSFKDAMLDALDSIHRRLTQMIAEQLMDQLFGQRGQDGGGQYGNWLSNIFGAMFGGGKASGGWASANRIFEVNERGLEMATVGGRDYMLTGNQPVHVTPNHKLPGGGSQVTTINMTLQGRMDRRSEQRVAQEVAVKQRMATVRG